MILEYVKVCTPSQTVGHRNIGSTFLFRYRSHVARKPQEKMTPLQSGFVRGDSTTYQLIHTYHQFCQAVDSGKEVRAVFCDVSKAFDRVWHRGLLHKLAGIGCSEFIIKWFSSYLSDRRQRVTGLRSSQEFLKDRSSDHYYSSSISMT